MLSQLEDGRKVWKQEEQMNFMSKSEQIIKKIISVIKSEKILYLAGIIVCLCNALFMFDNAIWGDEGFSIVLARQGIGGILSGTAADVHPPLYYLILKIVISILGESVFVLHLTSFLAFVGLCILIMTYVRKNFGLLSAYLALFFAGWTEYGVVYSVEIRMYSMALLFITLTFCMAYKVIGNADMKDWGIMSVFALLSGYTHYFALIAVAFMILGVFILCLVKKQEQVWKKIGVTVAICVVGYLPWLVAMLTTVERTVGDFWLTTVPTFRECMDMFLGAMDYSHKLFYVLIFLLLLYVLVNAYDAIKNKISVKDKVADILGHETKILMSILGIWTFIGTSVLGIVVSNHLQPVLLTRYLFPMVVLGAISLGVLVQYFGKKEKMELFVVLIAVMVVVWTAKSGLNAYQDRYQVFCDRKQQTDIALEKIDSYAEEDYIVMSDLAHFNWTVLEYYYPDNFVDYTEVEEKAIEINKAIMLVSRELNDDEIQGLENEKYTIDFQGEGKIDHVGFYLYSLERK